MTVGEQTIVADVHEALGENVEKEASEELDGVQVHAALATPVSIVFPVEAHLAIVKAEEALVGDGNPVGVASEVLEHLLGTTEGRLGIDHPGFVA
jgi:hypothetical protein